MTNKELLELAAKAADIPIADGEPSRMGFAGWNPLSNDGDALRLAVKLNILDGSPEFHHRRALEVAMLSDPYAATRRAIVRAAAEIGKDAQ